MTHTCILLKSVNPAGKEQMLREQAYIYKRFTGKELSNNDCIATDFVFPE